MDILQAIACRHSVRSYCDLPIASDVVAQLQQEIDACNKESGLHIQLITNEPTAFNSTMAHYGKFSGVQNYIALVGKKGATLDETAGYYGERVAIKAQMLGLNTCWVAMTFSKKTAKTRCKIQNGEKIVCVLSVGYGTTQGVEHKSKPFASVAKTDDTMPDWFRKGVECALLAPTAINQQKFMFELKSNTVFAKSTGGFFSKVDLGIVKYHFEMGAGMENFTWR